MTKNLSRDNHFVPQRYLQAWSEDGDRLWAYRTLVSHHSVHEWRRRSIKGLAFHRDLYTTFRDGIEVDDFEHWINELEQPAFEVIDRVRQEARLGRSDWEKLAMFFALQDLRTPLSFLESMDRWNKTMPALLEETSRKAIREYETLKKDGKAVHLEADIPFKDHFKVELDRSDRGRTGQVAIKTTVLLGRGLWIAQIRHFLVGISRALREHKWSIVRVKGKSEWFTTDHPALKLNFTSPNKYDFKGGWGSKGTDLMLPLTPRHLLFTNIGSDHPDYFTLSWDHTHLVQRMLAERAHRWIFATRRLDRVITFRKRVVNEELFKAEQVAMANWHEDNRKIEQ